MAANALEERPLFESHARRKHPELSLTRQPEGYEDPMAQALWDAWMASASRPAPLGMAEISPPGLNLAGMRARLGAPAFVPSAAQQAIVEQANELSAKAEREGRAPSDYFLDKCQSEAGSLPEEPPLALLMSMAMRVDHAIAMPSVPGFGPDPQTRRDNALRLLADMRRAYEEVSGHGFYHPERAQMYLDALASLHIGPDDV